MHSSSPASGKRSVSTTQSKKLLKDGSVPEKVIQKDILNWLKETGLLHWRQNSGTVMMGYRAIRLGEEGLPDIIVIAPPNGRILGLEVKSCHGTLRPAQRTFRDRLEATGGVYKVVRSVQEAMGAVALTLGEEQWKLLLNSGSAPKKAEKSYGPS